MKFTYKNILDDNGNPVIVDCTKEEYEKLESDIQNHVNDLAEYLLADQDFGYCIKKK